MTCIPLFMHDVLGFNTTQNGLVSAVPFAAKALAIPVGWLADWLRAPGRMSTNVVRKLFYAVGVFPCAGAVVATGFVGCDRVLAVALMFVAVAFESVSFTFVSTNQLDLAPLHAGNVVGLTNLMAKLSSIAAPHVVGALTHDRSTHAEWRAVFYLTAAIFAVGAGVFVVFGSGHRQRWADTGAAAIGINSARHAAAAAANNRLMPNSQRPTRRDETV